VRFRKPLFKFLDMPLGNRHVDWSGYYCIPGLAEEFDSLL